jgi:hypothetical protein
MTQNEIIEMAKRFGMTVELASHPAVKQLINEVVKQTENNFMQLCLDPENQPTQFGTATQEYREKEIKAALEAKDEPVAVVSGYYGGQCVVLPTNPARLFNSGTAFYTTPPQQEAKGDRPLCTAAMFDKWFLAKSGLDPNTPLYTAPPQRTWVGLTDEEIEDVVSRLTVSNKGVIYFSANLRDFARAIEAKLKEKNT